MIIAVNINKALANGLSVQNATERAWALSVAQCNKHDFVIGVEKGIIQGYFKLLDAVTDNEFPVRVKFKLKPCSAEEKQKNDSYIASVNANLSRIQRGKYIW